MPTSSDMTKSWHRRDFSKSHKNKHSARPLRDVGDGRFAFSDGLEVDKTKNGRVIRFHSAHPQRMVAQRSCAVRWALFIA